MNLRRELFVWLLRALKENARAERANTQRQMFMRKVIVWKQTHFSKLVHWKLVSLDGGEGKPVSEAGFRWSSSPTIHQKRGRNLGDIRYPISFEVRAH